MSAAALLDVKDLRVAFGDKEVVHGIDFASRRAKSWRWSASRARARP